MKKFLFFCLITLNIGFVIYAGHLDREIDLSVSAILSNNGHLVTEDRDCISGGPGSISCEIKENSLVMITCGVNCSSDKYACCTTFGCSCRDLRVSLTPAN